VYQAAWARPFSGMMSEFFIPSSAVVSAERDVSAAANISNVYQLKAQAGWTAMNCFGALSATPFFLWYEQDEFISSLSVTAKIPVGAPDANSAARNTITTTGYAQSTFYVKDGNSLRTALDITLTALNTWNGSVSAAWNRASNSAPYKALFGIFSSSIKRESIKLTRSDTISFSMHAFPKNTLNEARLGDSDFKYAFAFNHREEIALIKYVSLFIFAGGAWNYDTRLKTTLFEIPAGLGGKIVF
jgi:DNA polymerase-4